MSQVARSRKVLCGALVALAMALTPNLAAAQPTPTAVFGVPAPSVQAGPRGITIVAAPGVTPLRVENGRIVLPTPAALPTPSALPVPSMQGVFAPPPAPWAAPAAPAAPAPMAPWAPRAQDHPARAFGVFIGISDYPNNNDLPFCADDARRVQQSFVNAGLIDAIDTVVLTDHRANRAAVEGTLDRLARLMGPEDTLVFFFSGHGNQRPDRDRDEADGLDETILLADGPVSDDELGAWLRPVAGREIVALDSCYSGGFATEIASLGNSVGLYASREDQLSYVASEYNSGGYLSYFLSRSIDQSRGRDIAMWELQRDLSQAFSSSQAAGRQDVTFGVSRSTGTRTVLFDAPQQARPLLVASR